MARLPLLKYLGGASRYPNRNSATLDDCLIKRSVYFLLLARYTLQFYDNPSSSRCFSVNEMWDLSDLR